MQIDDNAGVLQVNSNMDLYGMLPGYNAEGHMESQMQQEAQSDLLPQDFAQFAQQPDQQFVVDPALF